MVKKSYKLQVKRKGKATIRVRVPPPTSGSQILHLRICPELLKSCICDPENLGGGQTPSWAGLITLLGDTKLRKKTGGHLLSLTFLIFCLSMSCPITYPCLLPVGNLTWVNKTWTLARQPASKGAIIKASYRKKVAPFSSTINFLFTLGKVKTYPCVVQFFFKRQGQGMSNNISMSPSSRKSHMGKQDLNFNKATCQQKGQILRKEYISYLVCYSLS